MKNARICPKCGKLVYFNSYFGAYICENCEWEDASYAKKRCLNCISASTDINKLRKMVGGEKMYLTAARQRIIAKKKTAI